MGMKKVRRKEPGKCVELAVVLELTINGGRIKRAIKDHYFYKSRQQPEHGVVLLLPLISVAMTRLTFPKVIAKVLPQHTGVQ